MYIQRESSGGHWFVSVLKMASYKIYFRHYFPFKVIKVRLMLIQNNLYSWIETTAWIVIEEALNTNFMIILRIWQEDSFDIIAMTPKETLRSCCVHISQLMTHPAIYILPLPSSYVTSLLAHCRDSMDRDSENSWIQILW